MKRGYLYVALVVGLCLLAIGFCARRKHDNKTDKQISSLLLPQADTAKVIVNPARHTIITVTRDKAGKTETRAGFLPRSGASIDVGKNGSIKVTARPWGTEIDPTVGVAFGSDIRLREAVGLNLFYVQRWEAGPVLLFGRDIHDTRLGIQVGYNALDNIYLSVGYDNRHTAHLMASLKF